MVSKTENKKKIAVLKDAPKKAEDVGVIPIAKIAARKWLVPHWKIMAAALATGLIVGLSTGAFPLFISNSVDILFDKSSQVPLWGISLAVFLLLFVRASATYANGFLNTYLAQKIGMDVQYDLLKHFLFNDYGETTKEHSGKIVSSFMNEAKQVNALIGSQIVVFLRNNVTLIGVFGSMIYINWRLSLFVIVLLPLVFFAMQFFSTQARQSSVDAFKNTGSIGQHIVETVRGAKIIRAFGAEKRELDQAQQKIKTLLRNIMRTQRAKAASGPSSELLVGIGIAFLFFYVGLQGRSGSFSQGDLVGFITALLLIYQPLKAVAGGLSEVKIAAGATQRVFDKLNVKAKITSPPRAKKLTINPKTKGELICFEKVSFAYPGYKNRALSDISFSIKAGTTTALVGLSGGGKSTIFNLLERFYDPNQGRIVINGQDIRQISLASLRQSISLVLQNVFLFDGTIIDNIAYAKKNAKKREIIAAARLANADEFIQNLPQGYQTEISEDGQTLSGGQRQRIAFARAALRAAPILLLDEPTSALDSKSEMAIQTGLRKIRQNRTTLIIAHRLSTIKDADQILVIDQGQIAEQGTHRQLIASGQIYAKLYREQSLLNPLMMDDELVRPKPDKKLAKPLSSKIST